MRQMPFAHVDATRRRFLAGTGLALAWAASGLPLRLAFGDEAAAPAAPGTARRLILLWMAGGPSQIDTFDPKPGRATGGPVKAIPTAVDGVAIAEHLPKLAALAGRFALVRGLTSKQGAHDRATHLYQTGYEPDATVAHPHLGAWIARHLGEPSTDLPAFVAVGTNEGSGFLGPDLAPYGIADVNRPVEDLLPPKMPDERIARRAALSAAFARAFDGRGGTDVVAAQRAARERARKLMASPHAAAFDVTKEPAAVQEAYGKTPFGRACLLARRLVEADVKVVHVTLGGWDTHRDNFPAVKRLCDQMDPAMARLLLDLEERSLLAETAVVWMGEFGRTPDINATNGRDHYPQAASCLLAGGGIPGGQVVGRTDEDGRKVVEGPVTPPELLATLLALTGVDRAERVITPAGRPIWPVPKEAEPVAALVPGTASPAYAPAAG